MDKSHKLAKDFVPAGLTKIRREVIRTTRTVLAKADILKPLRQLNEAARADSLSGSFYSFSLSFLSISSQRLSMSVVCRRKTAT